ncbi:YHYH protein [Candidatus Uabimicrobium sp. HlEnr_7]|uniref:YHYH protein n=1 Tax=Candidatus Uabimicrobium helgolandensis TaxID=3095367 RepID=UPI003557205E
MSYRIIICGFFCLMLQSAPEKKSFVRIDDQRGYRYIFTNSIPNHLHGSFPNRNNPNRISKIKRVYKVKSKPLVAKNTVPVAHYLFGVAINGIPFDPGTAEFWQRNRHSGWRYEALSGKINLGLDMNNAHVQPNGMYHYHGIPWQWLTKKVTTPDVTLVGYAADGFPIYALYGYKNNEISKMRSSYKIKKGMRKSGPRGYYDGTFVADYIYAANTGDLDECNGKFGVTPEYPQGTYHYYLTEDFPFVPRFFKGTPDFTFKKQKKGHRPQKSLSSQEKLLGKHFRHCRYCHELIRNNNLRIGRPPQWHKVPSAILQKIKTHAKNQQD